LDSELLCATHRRDAAFDFVNPEFVQHSSNIGLFRGSESHACGLFAVAQGGIDDADMAYW
jgi:hypothetical protein